MPSTALQSRISAFESLSSQPAKYSPRKNLLEAPLSPSASSLIPILPSRSISPSPSPPNLGRKTSLVDLKDWIVDDGPPPTRQNGFGVATAIDVTRTPTQPSYKTGPLINFESSSIQKAYKAPPLPPRRPSYSSLKSISSSSSNSIPKSALLSVSPPEHTYPPIASHNGNGNGKGHVAASSISSFHSVSLSDGSTDADSVSSAFAPTYPVDHTDSISFADDESFEDISTSSIASPTTAAALAYPTWEKRNPPKLPQRPPPASTATYKSPPPRPITSSSSSSSSTTTRRAAPPPPPRPQSARTSLTSASASDRSSIISTSTSITTTSRSSTSFPAAPLKRPTPVPPAARRRYVALFTACATQQRRAESERFEREKKSAMLLVPRKSRQAAGWRGLSVDLITGDDSQGMDIGNVGESRKTEELEDDRLEGNVVSLIWSRSKLDRGKLREIWAECDPASRGWLDVDAFVRGMWRIDEELRRARTRTSGNGVGFRIRQPPPPKPRPILR